MPTHNTRRTILESKKDNTKMNRSYSGPTLSTVISSITERMRGIPYLQQYEYLKEVVLYNKQEFVKQFFNQLNGQGNHVNEQWVTACKVRHQELSEILARIIDSDETLSLVVTAKTARGYRDFYDLEDIGYCPASFSIAGIADDHIVDIFINQSKPKIYGKLFTIMFKVASACKEVMGEEDELFSSLCDLALSIVEVGSLYNETNPGPIQWKQQEINTLNLLTSPRDMEIEEGMPELFEHVLNDIRVGSKPYVSELSKAIKSTKRYCKSKFSDDDYYYSSKSDPAKIKGFKYKQSILKSIVEVDPLKGNPFDEYSGYVSHYNTVEPNGYSAPWIKTIHIPNNGKYKTRAIHLALSPIQDRCCYIHNRLFATLNKIPSDCTIDQDKGRRFARKISDPEFRENHGWSSVYGFDWSNATDRLDPDFQERCLRLIFEEPVVEFWHTISSCDKEFHFKDGEIRPYKQVNGQPQGLLGSFDAFAFAHHVIMLMAMSLAGLENSNASDFYRCLGDDSIISSIGYDPGNIAGNSYVKACKYANLPINLTKSTIIGHDNPIALVDFAKVTVLNGDYFSPIPGRIANRIGNPRQDYYALSGALWQAKHGYFKPEWFLSIIDRYYKEEYDNHLAKLAMMSGIIPVFKDAGFSDEDLMNEEECVKMALCYAINKVKATLLSPLLGDKIKESLSMMGKEVNLDSLECLLPSDLTEVWDKMEDDEHKFNIALQNNLDKEDCIKDILSCSEDQASVISVTTGMSDSEFSVVQEALDMIKQAAEAPNTIMLYKENIYSLISSLKALDRLQYRSIYKRDALDSIIFRRSIKTFKLLFTEDTAIPS